MYIATASQELAKGELKQQINRLIIANIPDPTTKDGVNAKSDPTGVARRPKGSKAWMQ